MTTSTTQTQPEKNMETKYTIGDFGGIQEWRIDLFGLVWVRTFNLA